MDGCRCCREETGALEEESFIHGRGDLLSGYILIGLSPWASLSTRRMYVSVPYIGENKNWSNTHYIPPLHASRASLHNTTPAFDARAPERRMRTNGPDSGHRNREHIIEVNLVIVCGGDSEGDKDVGGGDKFGSGTQGA